MTTYRKIHGRSIQAVTTDPTEDIAEGQVWYNTTSDTFKTVLVSEAWSSGSPNLLQRRWMCRCWHKQQLYYAGGIHLVKLHNVTEEYNGSGWSAGGNLGTGRSAWKCRGTQTAGLIAGGYNGSNFNISEDYDGTSWTSGNNIYTARRVYGNLAGTQTAALSLVGGYTHYFCKYC